MASRGDGGGMQRIQAKLRQRLSNGEYYEAHQLYRTLYFRYTSQQKNDEAVELLEDGALALLNANQVSSGVDLALLLIAKMEKAYTAVNEKNIASITQLHRLIDRDHIERQTFVAAAIRWSRQAHPDSSGSAVASCNASVISPSNPSSGHPLLHAQFATTYWQECDYNQSRYHYVRSLDGEMCAAMLVEYHIRHGYPLEVDLFIAQVVFQYLCLQNKATAGVCFECYTKTHPQVEHGPPFVRPLLNFIWMLFIAIEGGSLPVFTILCERYQSTLKRDPSYNDYLDKIAQIFFHVPPPRSAAQGLFGNLLSSFMTFDDDVSDDGSEEHVLAEPQPVELD